MSDRDRLQEIISALPARQVHALLTLLDPPEVILNDEEFAHRLAMASEEEVDEETATRISAAEAETGEVMTHGEMKHRLGLLIRNCRPVVIGG